MDRVTWQQVVVIALGTVQVLGLAWLANLGKRIEARGKRFRRDDEPDQLA